MAPRISIALPTYKGTRFILEQLQSFVTQSQLPDEVVITDDCSQDQMADLVREFAAKTPFSVRYFSNPQQLGVNFNFENAIKKCTGDIILLSDQDDVWLNSHVASIAEPLKAAPETILVATNSMYVNTDLTPLGHTLWQAAGFNRGWPDKYQRAGALQLKVAIRHRCSAGHGLGFRRSLVPHIENFTPHWIYDQWIFLIAAAVGQVHLVREPQTLHRRHQNQAVGHRMKSLGQLASDGATIKRHHYDTEMRLWMDMAERLRSIENLPDKQAKLHLLEKKIALLEYRGEMRGTVLRRAYGSLTNLLTGKYHQLAKGWLTFARDVYG